MALNCKLGGMTFTVNTARKASAGNSCLRVCLVVRFSPRSICLMARIVGLPRSCADHP